MSKAEKFIKENTRNCSNEIAHWDIGGKSVKPIYSPWLTSDQTREAVEITREEVIEKVVEFLSKEENIPLWDDRSGNFGCDNLLLIENLKQAMKDE